MGGSWGAWGGSGLPEIASDLLPLHLMLPGPLCSGCSLPAALLELKFSELVADAFFVEIHSPWQTSRVHGNADLLDLAFVWLALYFVCFALCSSFSPKFSCLNSFDFISIYFISWLHSIAKSCLL